MERPKILYRGVVLSFEQFMNYDFEADLIPPNPPQIDEHGRKTVGDGNEYGVYMSTNSDMVRTAYAAPKGHASEFVGEKKICVGVRHECVNALPKVGIVYEIDTNGLEIRQPWISSVLSGHYNNGFMGEEWIADCVARENFRIKSIVVGSDFLHKEEELKDFSGIADMKAQVAEIFDARRSEVELVTNCLGTLSTSKLRDFSEGLKLKKLFQTGELQDINLEEIDASTVIGAIEYYLAMAKKLGRTSIDFSIEDIRKIASVPKENLLGVKKYKFVMGKREESIYLAQFEDQLSVLEQSTAVKKDENVFVKAGRRSLEGKMINAISSELKREATSEELATLISQYKESDEYDGEEGEELEEFALLYAAQRRFITASLEEQRKMFEDVVSGLNQFQISYKDGSIELYMQSSTGERVKGLEEVVLDEEMLKKSDHTLPQSMKKDVPDSFHFTVSTSERQVQESRNEAGQGRSHRREQVCGEMSH